MAIEMPRLGAPVMWQSGLMSPDVEFPRPGAISGAAPGADTDIALMRRLRERDARPPEGLVRRFRRPPYPPAYPLPPRHPLPPQCGRSPVAPVPAA